MYPSNFWEEFKTVRKALLDASQDVLVGSNAMIIFLMNVAVALAVIMRLTLAVGTETENVVEMEMLHVKYSSVNHTHEIFHCETYPM